jgi:hypothetical protein
MKVTFTSPLNFAGGAAIPAAIAATLAYTLFIDTVNPPAKSYPVDPAAVAAATKNADGSSTITVDCLKNQAVGFTPSPGTTYYIAVEDNVQEGGNAVVSPESPILTYTYELQPAAPGNFSVAS